MDSDGLLELKSNHISSLVTFSWQRKMKINATLLIITQEPRTFPSHTNYNSALFAASLDAFTGSFDSKIACISSIVRPGR